MEGLSSINNRYTQNIGGQKLPVTIPAQPQMPNQDNDKDKKLKKALIGLGITGAIIAAGIGVYCISKGRVKTEPPKVNSGSSSNIPGPKNVHKQHKPHKKTPKKPAQTGGQKPVVSNPSAQEANAAGKIIPVKTPTPKLTIETLKNNKIRVSYVVGNTTKSFEMPEYLYHITSKESMDKIITSGTLNISSNEQLPGLYLLDSENFLTRYNQTMVDGKAQDKFSALFKQANKFNPCNKNKQFGELVVIKIPTADLLKTEGGKFRVRTQEDFFDLQGRLNEIAKKAGFKKRVPLRSLYNDKTRENFKNTVLSKGIMDEASLDSFIREMTVKIHHGIKLHNASNLSDTHSLEYIFNKPIKLSDYPNIRIQKINPYNYIKAGTSNIIDPDKARSIFEGGFSPLVWPMAA